MIFDFFCLIAISVVIMCVDVLYLLSDTSKKLDCINVESDLNVFSQS